MAELFEYRVLRGNHGRWVDGESVTFKPGDHLELTEEQAANLVDVEGSQVERVSPPASSDGPAEPVDSEVETEVSEAEGAEVDTEEEGSEEGAADEEVETEVEAESADRWGLSDKTVPKVRELLAEIEDPDELVEIDQAESEGDDRIGVHNAVSERLEEIEGAAE